MGTIGEQQHEQKSYESKLYEIEARLEVLERSLEKKTDTKDVMVQIDELIKKKELITKAELNSFQEKMEAALQTNQIRIVKWVLGTGISSVAAIAAVMRIVF